MNAITTSSKSAVRFTIDFFNKTITGTKASFDKAGKGFGAEYEELTTKMAAHPDFTLVIKEQKHKATKAKRMLRGRKSVPISLISVRQKCQISLFP